MDNLIISMIVTLEDYENELGFNKNDIDNLIKKYDYLNNIECNELGLIILWKNKYIDDSKFGSLLDIKIEEGFFYLLLNNFDDILSNKYESEISILNGETSDWVYDNYWDVDIVNYWDEYDKDTYKTIYDFCIENKLEIEDEELTVQNLTFDDNGVYFNGESLEDYIDSDSGLSELKNNLNYAICDVQNNADFIEYYNRLVSNFEDKVGEFKWEDQNINDKNVTKLLIKINKDVIDDVKEHLEDTYENNRFDGGTHFSYFEDILKDMEFFDFDIPDMRYINGDIDYKDLNEITINKLYNY